MIAGLSALLVAALVLGALIIGDTRRRTDDQGPWRTPGWISLGCGTAALLAVAAPMIGSAMAPDGVDQISRTAPWLYPASITLGLVGLVAGLFSFGRFPATNPYLVGLFAVSCLVAALGCRLVLDALRRRTRP